MARLLSPRKINLSPILQFNSYLKVIQIITVALIGFSVGACCVPFSEGMKVDVTNEGPKSISDLKIYFKGGNKTLSELAGGSTHEFVVKPSGETDIRISFTDASGVARSYKVDVYFETNYQGKIDIKLDRLGSITWKDDITPCPS